MILILLHISHPANQRDLEFHAFDNKEIFLLNFINLNKFLG